MFADWQAVVGANHEWRQLERAGGWQELQYKRFILIFCSFLDSLMTGLYLKYKACRAEPSSWTLKWKLQN